MQPTRVKFYLSLTALVALAALVMAGERVRGITFNTLQLAAAVVAIAVPLGTLVALLLTKTNLPGRRWMLAVFAVLLFVPLYLHAAAWQAALGVSGWLTPPGNGYSGWVWIDGWRGTIWIHSMAATPWVVCLIAAASCRTNGEAEAAASLAVPGWRVLWSITLPALRPAMAIATLWTAVSVAVEMTVTDFFQIRTFAEEVYTVAAMGGFQTDNPADDYAPQSPWLVSTGLIAGTLLLAALSLAVLVGVARYLRGLTKRNSLRSWRWQLGGGRWGLTAVPLAVLLLVLVLPVLALAYKAGLGSEQTADGWRRVWSIGKLGSELQHAPAGHWREAMQSVLLGVGVATAATVVGCVLGWRVRTANRLPILLLLGLAVALAMPGPVLGISLIPVLNQPHDSMLWWLGELYNSLFSPWLLQTIRLLPVATLAMAAAFASVPTALLDAARVAGIVWWQQLLRVALPLAARMMAATWLIVFALSVGELASTILVMPPGRQTLAIHLFNLLHYGVEDQVAAVALLLLALLMLLAGAIVAVVPHNRQA